MDFKEILYLNWARETEKGPGVYPLFGSGIKKVHLAELRKMGFGLKDLEIAVEPDDTHGLLKLKQALARRYKVKPANVTLTGATSMALFLVSCTLLKAGDEVIVEHPCYEPVLKTPQALGARIKRLPRRFVNQFQPDLRELKKLLTRRTKAIYLTNLHNPSGVLIKPELLREIARLARQVNAYVICNEVYLDFLLEKTPPPAFTLAHNMITVTSLSKVYGLGGVRAGWILANESLSQRLDHVLDYVVGKYSYPSEKIAFFGLKKINRLQDRTRKIVSTNWPIIRNWMANQKLLRWVEPAGGIICFPKLPHGINSMKFVNYLKRNYNTLAVPGEFFQAPGYIRLGFGSPPGILQEGLKRLNQALIKFSPRRH